MAIRNIGRVGVIAAVLIVGVLLVNMSWCEKKKPVEKEQFVWHISGPQDVLDFMPHSAQEIEARTQEYLADEKKAIDALIAIPTDKRTFANTIQELDRIDSLSNLVTWVHMLCLLEQVSPVAEIRKAAHEAINTAQEFFVDNISKNRNLYLAIKAYADENAAKEELTEVQRYALDELMKDFKRSGLDLPDDRLAHVRELSKKLSKQLMQFDTNISEDKTSINATREELAGLPDDFIEHLEKNEDGSYKLKMDYPTLFAVMDECEVEDTRKRMQKASQNRAYPINDELLKEIKQTRHELAQALGYASYAHLDLDSQMVMHPSRAYDFLLDLLNRAKEKEEQEIAELTRELPESVTQTEEGKWKNWDFAYLKNVYKKREFNLDEQKIAEYFPMQKTIEGLLDIYRQFMTLDFYEVPIKNTWHEDVRALAVTSPDRKIVHGYIFLDLHPRDNKYNHAAHFGMVPAFVGSNDKTVPAVSTLVTNFPKPRGDKPALLKRDDVRTFFHEFGHALHAMLGRTPLAGMSGTSVKRDFVELPSQMLEEWLWDSDILKRVSSHYKTGEALPDEMIDAILALKNFDSGSWVRRQGFLALYSLGVFDENNRDLHDYMLELLSTYRPHFELDRDNHLYASFGHLGGYGSKYYGYLWSKVFALDIFDEIKKHGLLDPVVGQRYVGAVLSKGGSKDPNKLLYDFLGREPRSDAFFEDMGVGSAS